MYTMFLSEVTIKLRRRQKGGFRVPDF